MDYPTAGDLTQIHLSNFSNSGDAVSVTAVGSQVVTTIPVVDVQYPIFGSKKDYASVSGTSFSTPLVSGIAALIKSHFPEMNNSEIRDQVQRAVWDVGDTGWDNEFGWGLVDFQKALVSGTHASNEAFNLGVTASPILPDDIIIIVKAKVGMTNKPVIYYVISDIHGIIESGTIDIKAIPGDGTIFSGRLHTERIGAINFSVCGTSVSGPLPDLYLEYHKKDF